LRQRMEPQNLNEPTAKPEVFSRTERRIAKCGLCAAIPTWALYVLYQAFPGQPQIAAMFVLLGALTLIAASLCVLAKPAEMTTKAVKKAAKWGLLYAGRVSTNLKASKRLVTLLQNGKILTCRVRTSVRASRGVSRPTFAHTSGSSGDKGSDDGSSDQGDPPGPSHQHTVTPFTLCDKKLNSSDAPRLSLYGLGCWLMSGNRHDSRGYAV
jgi:hypothetical protein